MHIIRGIIHEKRPLDQALSQQLPACVLTMGNFDGVHLGHQQLLKQLIQKAREKQLPSVVITFELQPQEYFLAAKAQEITKTRLMRLREKCRALAEMGVDYCVCLNFNEQFAQVSAEDFVEQLLVKQLGVKAVIIGDDFRFGAKRQGTRELLIELGQRWGYEVNQLETIQCDAERVSSSRVRQALLNNNFEQAKQLLGRDYFLTGRVIHGDKRGRELGFPTANLYCAHQGILLRGIFAVTINGVEPSPLKGVANFGYRPMFNNDRLWLEVFIFDYSGDLYGKELTVNFIHKLRDEACFDTLEELVSQMQRDVAEAKKILQVKVEI